MWIGSGKWVGVFGFLHRCFVLFSKTWALIWKFPNKKCFLHPPLFPSSSFHYAENPRERSSNSNSADFYFSRKPMMISPSLRMALHLNAGFRLFLSPNQRFSSNGSLKYRKIWKHSMSLRAKAAISDGVLRINGKEALKGVPENVVIKPSTKASAFLGAVSQERSCRHIFKLGVLEWVFWGFQNSSFCHFFLRVLWDLFIYLLCISVVLLKFDGFLVVWAIQFSCVSGVIFFFFWHCNIYKLECIFRILPMEYNVDVLKIHGVLLLALAFDGFRLLDNGVFYVLLRCFSLPLKEVNYSWFLAQWNTM